ncbi:MAG: terminase [Ruminococcus sp.]|nr:terminase [Ruminococcus sp.]
MNNVSADFLEGTTASGKTTIGAGIKFMRMVSASPKKFHIIASKTTGTAEKNIIQQDNGVLDLHCNAQYFGNGDKDNKLPHIKFEGKIIYVLGYDNKDKWKNVLGSQFGCVYIDEINTADIEFVREISTRNDYLIATLNPDDPSLPVYKEFVNRSRPYKKYISDVPAEIMQELTEEPVTGWRYWFFSFRDNLSLTQADIDKKIQSAPKGTKLYKNKILGLRGRATGLVFDLRKSSIITEEQAKKYNFVLFSSALDTAYSQSSPDTIAFTFIGITSNRKCIVLAEEVYNNRDLEKPLTPSDIPYRFTDFLERNRRQWGFARDVYIDSADQATVLECQKFKHLTGSIYNFIPAFKKTKIIDRIHMQSAWLSAGDFLVLDCCKNYISEMNIYSWKEDKYEPEDNHDHCINSVQYAFLPYKDKIGSVKFEI